MFGTLLTSAEAIGLLKKAKNQDSGGTSVKRVKVKKKSATSESKTKNVRVKKS